MTARGVKISKVEPVGHMKTGELAGVNSQIVWRLKQLSGGSEDLDDALGGLAKHWGYSQSAAYMATRGKAGWEVYAAGATDELRELLQNLDSPDELFSDEEERDYSSLEFLNGGEIAICRKVGDGGPSTGIALFGRAREDAQEEPTGCFQYKMIIEICALSRAISSGLVERQSKNCPRLSEDEIGLLNLTKQGHSAKAIASMLGLTAGQVNHRVKRVCARLGCSNRVELIAFAVQTGMIASS